MCSVMHPAVAFNKVTGIYGDIEKLGVNTNNLDGARKIDVSTVVEGGDARPCA